MFHGCQQVIIFNIWYSSGSYEVLDIIEKIDNDSMGINYIHNY